MKRKWVWAGAVVWAALFLFGVTGIIRWIAGDAGGMKEAMLRFAPPEMTGFPESAYGGVTRMITGYLTGQVDEFQYRLRGKGGELYPCFHDYEAKHMEDCRELIRLDTAVCVGSLAAALIFGIAVIVAVVRMKKVTGLEESAQRKIATGQEDKTQQLTGAGTKAARGILRDFYRGAARGMAALGAVASALLIWACVNFEGLFITFHRAAFRNDLWLLDPRTDMLIRLMPEELFIHFGEKGLIAAAVWTLLLLAGILILRIWTREVKQEHS